MYGALLLAGAAYWLLQRVIIRQHGPGSALARHLGPDLKGYGSLGLYAASIPLSFASRWAAIAIFVGVALMWLVPDRRIERALAEDARG